MNNSSMAANIPTVTKAVGDPVGAKQGDPYGEVVAAEGHRHHEGGERTPSKDLVRRSVAVSPRVTTPEPTVPGREGRSRKGIGVSKDPRPPARTSNVATPRAWA